uniref:Uncharacterized protein n=1 Tax=Arundo donax TaxID=35708 RepID=A0A0A9AUJ4_ARUDO
MPLFFLSDGGVLCCGGKKIQIWGIVYLGVCCIDKDTIVQFRATLHFFMI